MKRLPISLLALFIIVSHTNRGAVALEPSQEVKVKEGQEVKLKEKIIGSWKLVSSKYGGQEFHYPAGTTTIKHVTPSQFMWVTYDEDGKVTRTAGGSYTLNGDVYEESPAYGLSSDFDIIKGKTHTFQCRIDANTWHHDGKLSYGQTIEEVWERVERK
jgi:hypothetical protein